MVDCAPINGFVTLYAGPFTHPWAFKLKTKKLYGVFGANPFAVKVVALFLCTTVPLPNASPVLYNIPFAGSAPSEADNDLTTKYWSAVVAVKEPAMLVVVEVLKVRLEGWVVGATHGGKPAIVVAFPLSTVVV